MPSRYGNIVDNDSVGKDLAEIYWKPGNRAKFLDLVQVLTGKPLSASAWVDSLSVPVHKLVANEREAYMEGFEIGPKYRAGMEVDLDMRILLVDGDVVIADSKENGGLHKACDVYKQWLANWKM